MAINNSTCKDEQEIGQEVSKWMNIYNKNYGKITNVLQEHIVVCVTQLLRKYNKVSNVVYMLENR